MSSKPLALVVAILFIRESAYGQVRHSPAGFRPRTTLLFVDVTSSLTQLQIDQVIQTAGTIIDSVHDGSDLLVYAIQADAEAPPFREHRFRSPQSRTEMHQVDSERASLKKTVSNDIMDLYCSINWNDERTKKACRDRQVLPHPQDDLRSCILGILPHIARKIADLDRNGKGPARIVIVSDMIEECERNPLHQMIKLTHPNLSSDMANIPRFQNLPDLAGSQIVVIVPQTMAAPDPRLPAFNDLRAYWGSVLSTCNVDWRFESEVPEDLKHPPAR